MLESIFELINQAAANSALVFCFCNLIIAIILVDSKSGSNNDEQTEVSLSTTNPTSNRKQGMSEKQVRVIAHELETTQKSMEVYGKSNSCRDEEKEEENGENEEDDDELRRRVEEFIAKVNRGWKAEMLRTSCCL